MPPVSEVEVTVTEGRVTVEGLSRADCLCPVCLEIFIEPVTLPCEHTFCKPCFLETVDKANLCCPLCRKRVSTWARHNGRKKTLVNDELWRQVQASFPLQCQRRLSGVEEEEDCTSIPTPKVCEPGELRREYEDQITKLAEEKRALEEAERRASEEYIQRLLAEEEDRLAEERRRQEEKQLEDDEKMAVMLSRELNPIPISESHSNSGPSEATPARKKPNAQAGGIERFLFPVPLKPNSPSETSPTSSFLANKENILQSQPVKDLAEPPMPSLDFYGLQEGSRSRGEPTPSSGDRDDQPTFSSSSSHLHREQLLFSRRQQEEEDMRLALSLQKQLNREESQRAVDRSKGSNDQYQLRRKPRPQPSPGPGPGSSAAGRPKRRSRPSSTASKVLVPLACLSMVAGTLLLFPDFQVRYLSERHLTREVNFGTGLWASGFLVLIGARAFVSGSMKKGRFAFRSEMVYQVGYSCVTLASAAFSCLVSVSGLARGPFCLYNDTTGRRWGSPFRQQDRGDPVYLFNRTSWGLACEEPRQVVLWNVALFSVVIATSGLQVALCVAHALNSLLGIVFGPGYRKNKVC
ncbi:E3 ubiquitin-protein ligase rnf168-like [Aplochiton taeniatus]